MKLNCGLPVWQKPKDFSSQITSFLWKGHEKRLRGQTIGKTVTIPNRTEPNLIGRNSLFETEQCVPDLMVKRHFVDLVTLCFHLHFSTEPTHPPTTDVPSADLTCSDNTMTALVPRSVIGYEVDADNLHFVDSSCVGADYNSTHVVLSTPFDQCGTVMEVINLLLVYCLIRMI